MYSLLEFYSSWRAYEFYPEGRTRKLEVTLSVTVRKKRAVPRDRGRPFAFIFSQYKRYPKRLTAMTFAEVGVLFLRDITTS